ILHDILDKFEPIKEKFPELYDRLNEIAASGTPRFDMNEEGLRSYYSFDTDYNPTHAYIHLESADQNIIIRSIFEGILSNPNWHELLIYPILTELFRVADNTSLEIIARAMDLRPIYMHEFVNINREKALKLRELLTEPFSMIVLDRSLVGIPNYLENLSNKKAEEHLELYLAKGQQSIVLHYLDSRDELRHMVLDRIEKMAIDWDSIQSFTYLNYILKKRDDKSVHTAAKIAERTNKALLIRWINTMEPSHETYSLLRLLLNHLSSPESIMLFIFGLVHLGNNLEIDTSDLWETRQYLSLSGDERIELKSGRWNPNVLMRPESTKTPE
ncbi:MAG: hypothetical protein ACFFER_17310, partial [Candidatus Thorarchaeota archaeon]